MPLPMPLPLPALLLLVFLVMPRAALAEEPWRITLPATVDAEPDVPGAVSLSIAAREGYTISRDGPLLIDLTAEPPGALTLPRRRLQRRDAADAQAEAPRFDLKFRARTEGDHRLTASIRFWICARRTCRPVRSRASVTIRTQKVAPPPPAPAPPAPPPPAAPPA